MQYNVCVDNVILHFRRRTIVRCRLRAALIFCLLPGLAVASVVVNMVEVTAGNAEKLGFHVSVVTSSTKPRTSARISYPPRINEIWIANFAEIIYKEVKVNSRFVSSIDLGLNGDRSISFLLDDQHGTHDATVVIHYRCEQIEDPRCNGWSNRMYYFSSILSYEGQERR
jgi:hypothetical protein